VSRAAEADLFHQHLTRLRVEAVTCRDVRECRAGQLPADGVAFEAAFLFRQAERDELGPLTFLDLDWNIVNRVLEREKRERRSGPIAETVLRDVGVVAARVA